MLRVLHLEGVPCYYYTKPPYGSGWGLCSPFSGLKGQRTNYYSNPPIVLPTGFAPVRGFARTRFLVLRVCYSSKRAWYVLGEIRTHTHSREHGPEPCGSSNSTHEDICLSGTQPTAPLWLTHNGHDAPCKPSTLKKLWSERQDLNLRKTPVPKTGGLTKLAHVPLSIPRGRSVYYHTLTDLSARLLFILRANSVRTFNFSWPLGIFHMER